MLRISERRLVYDAIYALPVVRCDWRCSFFYIVHSMSLLPCNVSPSQLPFQPSITCMPSGPLASDVRTELPVLAIPNWVEGGMKLCFPRHRLGVLDHSTPNPASIPSINRCLRQLWPALRPIFHLAGLPLLSR